MLCSLCESCLTNLLHRDVATWKRLKDTDWFAFKHGNYQTITASASAGCELCHLFNHVRRERIRNFDGLAEKWHSQCAMIDAQLSAGLRIFQLLTEAPEKSWIPFELYQPTPNTRKAGYGILELTPESALPLQVLPDATSDHIIRLAQRWIDSCEREHGSCLRRDALPLPTRVIDVSSADGLPAARLKVNPDRNQFGRYVTLSHCWGTGERLTTLKRNLVDFQQVIPHTRLPPTFRDAITLTRMLGLRYLWIDALCIVQDDREDWQRESAAMCAVYENATFSISAISAIDSDSGLFLRHDHGSCITTIDDVSIGVRPQLDTLDMALQHSKLESRAWCMQERILAPAILHVGPQQWYWECRAGEFSESHPAGQALPQNQESTSTSTKFRHIPVGASHVQLLAIWYDLVSQYSIRDLTKPSDRLPAIAGLADRFSRELGNSSIYIYGLWTNDFLTGLLWQRPVQRFQKLIPSRDHYSAVTSYAQKQGRFASAVAPSWSWAAVRGAVSYAWKETYDNLVPLVSRDLFAASLDPTVPFARIHGCLRRGTCRLSQIAASSPTTTATVDVSGAGNAMFRPSGSRLADEGVACILDDVEDIIPKSCYCLRVSSWQQRQQTGVLGEKAKKGPKVKVDAKVFYLILQRIQSSMDDPASPSSKTMSYLGKFRRIGMGFDEPKKVENVFLNAERHEIVLA